MNRAEIERARKLLAYENKLEELKKLFDSAKKDHDVAKASEYGDKYLALAKEYEEFLSS